MACDIGVSQSGSWLFMIQILLFIHHLYSIYGRRVTGLWLYGDAILGYLKLKRK